MRKYLLPFIGASMLFGTSAMANCWDECVLPNPISGGCGKSVKVCDIENPGRAAASLTTDIHAAGGLVAAAWHDAWGDVPDPIRKVLEEHPISILATIFPETQAYALAIAAIEEYAARGARRSHEGHDIVANEPEWKKKAMIEGEAVLLFLEGIETSNASYNSQLPPNLVKYDGPWETFKGCIRGADSSDRAASCVSTLKKQAAVL